MLLFGGVGFRDQFGDPLVFLCILGCQLRDLAHDRMGFGGRSKGRIGLSTRALRLDQAQLIDSILQKLDVTLDHCT